MKPGDLVQVWAPRIVEQSRFHGHLAIVLGDEVIRAPDGAYLQVFCDGPRMMPLYWLRPLGFVWEL